MHSQLMVGVQPGALSVIQMAEFTPMTARNSQSVQATKQSLSHGHSVHQPLRGHCYHTLPARQQSRLGLAHPQQRGSNPSTASCLIGIMVRALTVTAAGSFIGVHTALRWGIQLLPALLSQHMLPLIHQMSPWCSQVNYIIIATAHASCRSQSLITLLILTSISNILTHILCMLGQMP